MTVPGWAIDKAALPVWYQEQAEKVRNLEATVDTRTHPDVAEAMRAVVEIHRARLVVLEALMAEALEQ